MKSVALFILAVGIAYLSQAKIPKIPSPHLTLADSSNNYQEYVGKYKMAENGFITNYNITIKDGELYGAADDYGANRLIKQKDADTFLSTSQYGSTIIFQRDSDTKKVKGLKLVLQNNEMLGTKQ